MTVLEYLWGDDGHIEAPCAGKGNCGKCLIRVVTDCPVPTETEARWLSSEQLEKGYRLACCVMYTPGLGFESCGADGEFSMLTYYLGMTEYSSVAIADVKELGIAIDIGTTTIAFALVDMGSGVVYSSHAVMNRQRALGADVISRIQQANEGHLEQLHRYVVEDILQGIAYINEEFSGEISGKIRSVVIAGNTTMLHILLNTPCQSLGVYPFTPVFLDMQRHRFADIFGADACDAEVLLLPGISTYVGADVSAGIFSLSNEKKPWLLIDLGTNGEMALFSEGGIVATSTAAGPAFEGGNISCGTGSIAGAISGVVYQPDGKEFAIETIGNQPPVGICGSGVLDIVGQLVKFGLLDESGYLDEDEFEDGFVTIAPGIQFTQKDVREFQLAKSAIRAGIEVLLAETSNSYADIECVYVAGGFGHKMNLDSAILIGMLPPEWQEKIYSVGNAALGGCVKVLTPDADIDKITVLGEFEEIIKNAKEINLSTHPLFNDGFMEYMMFENASDRKV